MVIANLFASRLTLLYGPSGVGKTSLLQAGLLPALRSRADVVPVLVRGWHTVTPLTLVGEVARSPGATVDGTPTFGEALAHVAAATRRRVMVIVDQFEQFFVHDLDQEVERQLVQAIAHAHVLVSFVISLREDALAQLDRFEGRIPDLFENYLRVEHLGRAGAQEAIVRPLEEYERRFGGGVRADPDLVSAVLDDLESEESRATTLGHDIVEGRGRIQTPYLQIVMSRLWEETRRRGATTIEPQAFEDLGRSREIFFAHFDEVLASLTDDEQELVAKAFQHLVTPSGWKIVMPVLDLASYVDVEPAALEPILAKLAGEARILRTVPLPGRDDAAYEIYHDVLAEVILEWRSRRDRRQLQARYAIEYGATFQELTVAHSLWQREVRERGAAGPETEARYRSLLAGFEETHGVIVQAYWSEDGESATALTAQTPSDRRGRRRPYLRLHRAGDWIARGESGVVIADLLARSDALAARAGEILVGTSAEIALRWILATQAYLLGAIDRLALGGDDSALRELEADAAPRSVEAELRRIEDYIARAADRSARVAFVTGLVTGLLGLVVLFAVGALVAAAAGANTTAARDVVAAGLAGAVGAVVSVVARMARKSFSLDYDVGRPAIRILGALRPAVGATFGVSVYLLLGAFTTIVSDLYTLVTLAFLAGFAEGFAQTTLVAAEKLAPAGADSDERQPEPR